MSVSLGSVIWSSVKPIIKIYLIIGTGFMLSKFDIITVQSTKAISDIILTVLLPCLSFNKIVSNIEDKDIKDVGIICLSSVLIFGTGLFFAYVVRRTMPVPKQWRGGILAGGMFPNISDLPIAYLQTLAQGFIFTPEEGDKGVANVIIFLAMFLICVFNLGGFRLIEMDFNYNDEENATINESTTDIQSNDKEITEFEKQKNGFSKLTTSDNEKSKKSESSDISSLPSTAVVDQSLSIPRSGSIHPGNELVGNESVISSIISNPSIVLSTSDESSTSNFSYKGKSNNADKVTTPVLKTQSQPVAYTSSVASIQEKVKRRPRSKSTSSQYTMNELIKQYSKVDQYGNPIDKNDASSVTGPHHDINGVEVQPTRQSNLTRILTSDATVSKHDIESSGSSLPKWLRKFPLTPLIVFFIKNCFRPCSAAVIIALTCAFIPWVKALFVTTDTTPHIRQAPDQQPALSFIMDFTGYVGAASVPFGLILLGATLGRLKIGSLYPGFWKSACVLVVLRQCVMPIFGVLWCDRLVKAGWLNWENDKLLLFVIAINWSLPTMTTIIYFTASYTPADMPNPIQMECVSFFLMIQYPLLVVSLPFLVTYFLKVQIKV
ncbi:hypothetical protein Kpol_1020p44 [Vanderwaltozyma polyspora DSM 70294]|uniref:Protein ECM3 n=1 Tax=Vanderwaltozyma polyspora (strain ATCC 22028 / DSM 70294 / BCRC 21397 / CBS 2163 / NBRC 10782 / NRRL Y-8283 / UCD 57-17) TaxID=436907 RepID=A7TLF4_VANPO|nr:uncharacterized protein Kpol_1020p44 [Vanderwaltozyma polyspora DSM 70294]EDO16935.1 hypothetical protein Kpol_1020p44 [Vanderwaltozyma polyspora DSM 70294]